MDPHKEQGCLNGQSGMEDVSSHTHTHTHRATAQGESEQAEWEAGEKSLLPRSISRYARVYVLCNAHNNLPNALLSDTSVTSFHTSL